MIIVEHHSAQKLHLSAITLLQIFDLVFTGSRVATTFVMSHMYCIYWELFIYPQLHRHLNEGWHTQLGWYCCTGITHNSSLKYYYCSSMPYLIVSLFLFRCGAMKIVRYLVEEKGCQLSTTNNHGSTPLHLACMWVPPSYRTMDCVCVCACIGSVSLFGVAYTSVSI